MKTWVATFLMPYGYEVERFIVADTPLGYDEHEWAAYIAWTGSDVAIFGASDQPALLKVEEESAR